MSIQKEKIISLTLFFAIKKLSKIEEKLKLFNDTETMPLKRHHHVRHHIRKHHKKYLLG